MFLFSFLSWMDKLGVSAREGLGVVMRQTYYGLYYPLTDKNNLPNPVSREQVCIFHM